MNFHKTSSDFCKNTEENESAFPVQRGAAKHTAITECSLYLFIVLLAITHHKWVDSRWSQSSQNSKKHKILNQNVLFCYEMCCNNACMLLHCMSVCLQAQFDVLERPTNQLCIGVSTIYVYYSIFYNISQFLSTFTFAPQLFLALQLYSWL